MIKIYTYSDPYRIDDEAYWDEIKNMPHFCVSQTLANGIGALYPHFKENCQISIVDKLVNKLYQDWTSQKRKVNQMMDVDNAITRVANDNSFDENIKRSLQFNTKSIVNSLRIFAELGLHPENFNISNINNDQKYLIELYKLVFGHKSFCFDRVNDKESIIKAILDSLELKDSKPQQNILKNNSIVIHGVHQFSPAILCAIEDISKHYDVVFLFNYQKKYKEVYSTWLNVYSTFDIPINIYTENQFVPTSLFVDSYSSNLLGDCIGKISNGEPVDYSDELKQLEVIEFENNTEFANYCARVFENAKKEANRSNNKVSTISLMREQFYSPSNKVNDILRSYFPEQFGERHFLDYPIGHFFVSAMNMWDEEEKKVVIKDFSEIKECLSSGIIVEEHKGELLNTFNNTFSFFANENSLIAIINKLKTLKKYVNSTDVEMNRVGFFNVTKVALERLISALSELNSIVYSFFEDFTVTGDNFRNFYNRIQKFIISKMSDLNDLDGEMVLVIQKLLEKLENTDLPEGGSYSCLKQTMTYYLSQDEFLNKGAHWITRRFEQIDGDILLSNHQNSNKTSYHFCCLSDKDICDCNDERLPWPLDVKFFEYAHIPLDTKYQVFVKSKIEHKNFNKYALLYGVLFNRVSCKLSYVKTENNKDKDLYFIFKLLGVKLTKYSSYENGVASIPYKIDLETSLYKIKYLDKIKASICPYRFALECIVQEKTIFRENFLIHHYLRVILWARCLTKLQGKIYKEDETRSMIDSEYQGICDTYRLSDGLEKLRLQTSVFKDLRHYVSNNRYHTLSSVDYENINIKYDLLLVDLKDIKVISDDEMKEIICTAKFDKRRGKYCTYCSIRDICLSYKD